MAKDAEQRLQTILGVSPEVMQLLTYRPQRTSNKFIYLTDSEQKVLLTGLLGLDQFEKEYPGVKVLCQSWINLMISNNHRVSQPVLTRFGPETEVLVTFAKSKMDHDSAKDLLHDIELSQQRNFDWKWLHSQGLLCADRTHPNRKAHKILFDYLIPHISQL
jgi:hypothetical protein